MSTPPAVIEPSRVAELPPRTVSSLQVGNFDQAIKLAQMMAQSKLVPNHLQDKPADCLLVIEQASRWNMSPFAVAQATSVISGKLMFEGKLVTAAINSSGVLVGRLRFDVSADQCIASATLRGEAEPRTVTVNLKDVRTSNSMWTKQPEQQLCYSAARIWGRRHVPEVMLGVYSPEEDFDQSQPTASPETETPPARPEKLPYPVESFEKNLPSWKALIADGKKTPQQIIATLESKATLTNEQHATIMELPDVIQQEKDANENA